MVDDFLNHLFFHLLLIKSMYNIKIFCISFLDLFCSFTETLKRNRRSIHWSSYVFIIHPCANIKHEQHLRIPYFVNKFRPSFRFFLSVKYPQFLFQNDKQFIRFLFKQYRKRFYGIRCLGNQCYIMVQLWQTPLTLFPPNIHGILVYIIWFISYTPRFVYPLQVVFAIASYVT